MEDFAKSINEFLAFRRYDILEGKGRISAQDAKEKAEAEYGIFNKHQKINSDNSFGMCKKRIFYI